VCDVEYEAAREKSYSSRSKGLAVAESCRVVKRHSLWCGGSNEVNE
jgi:hypothetical protein